MKNNTIRWLDTIIGESLKSVYNSLDENVDRIVSKTQISSLRQDYFAHLQEAIKYIYLPYMSDHRLIAELFVELYAFKTPKKYRLRQKSYMEDEDIGYDIVNTKDLLLSHNRIAILGEPGAGKTTFLRRIAYSICSEDNIFAFNDSQSYFPVIIECRGNKIAYAVDNYSSRLSTREAKARELQKDGKSEDYINRKLPSIPHPMIIAVAEVLKDHNFPYPEYLTIEFLKKGNLMLFVDGLDEAQSRHRRIISEGLELLSSHYGSNRLLVSCRTAEAENLPKGFTISEITPLYEDQKRRFVKTWFSTNQEDAQQFLSKVSNTHIWNISDRPLLLTLLCALYQAGGDLPKYKVDLYRECAELALRRWDSIRNVKRNTAFADLTTSQRMDILSKVAADMMIENRTQVSRSFLNTKVAIAMEESSVQGSPSDLINEFICHTGLINQVAINSFSFSHKSLQEFFAARFFSASNPTLPIEKLKDDIQWLVTVEMTACMVPDATPMLLIMTTKIKKLGVGEFKVFVTAIEFIYNNPLTISLDGRKQLIKRALHSIRTLRDIAAFAIVIDNNIIKRFHCDTFSKLRVIRVDITSDLSVFFYLNPDQPPVETRVVEAMSHSICFIFMLLIHAYSVIEQLNSDTNNKWFISVLMSALIHSDPSVKRTSTKQLLGDLGRRIYRNLEFHQLQTSGNN